MARLPAELVPATLADVVACRSSLDLSLAGVLLVRLAEQPQEVRDPLLADGSIFRESLLGRWLLAESWLADRTKSASCVQLWTELVEQASGVAAEALLGRARARREAGDPHGCVSDLFDVAKRTLEYGVLSKAARLLERVRVRAGIPGRRVRVAIVSSSTIDLLPPLLRLLGGRDGLAVEVYCAPYGSYRQELLDPRSGLHAFRPDFVIVALHWRDAALEPVGNDRNAAERIFSELEQLWGAARQSSSCTILQHAFDFPPHESGGYISASEENGRYAILSEVNCRLFASRVPGVLVVDCPTLAAQIGCDRWSDDSLWHVAKQHPSPAGLPKLVHRYVRLMAARLGLARKVAVFDLDNTLWGGVVGEDGPHGLKVGAPTAIGEAHAALQRYAKELKRRGVLLAVCSKNNDKDAREPFRQTLGMELKEEDFVAFIANWEEKPDNLRQLASMLNVGTDSLVFIDDNPLERAKVRRAMPEVAVVDLPADPAGYVAALDRGDYFEALALSAEDLSRHQSYVANVRRDTLKGETGDVESFLRRLDMRMHHGAFNEAVQERVVQLFNKTNQFNVTTRRHGAAEVSAMRSDPQVWTQYFRLLDCFGDNGLIGLVVARPAEAGEVWEIDSLLMSCRVLGRRAEEFMVAELLEEARRRGVRTVRGRYVPTAKNTIVADLFPRLGFILESMGSDGKGSWVWDVAAKEVPRVQFVRSAGP